MFWTNIKTLLLLATLGAVFVFFGDLVGGTSGAFFGLVLAILMNLGAYFYSDKIVLAMYGAVPLPRERYPYVYDIVESLAERAGLPTPRLYLVRLGVPNAFATGRSPSNAAIAVSESLLKILSPEELEGVLGHEMAHIKNRDMLITVMAATLATAIDFMVRAFIWAPRRRRENGGIIFTLAAIFLVPLAALLVRLAISRTREFGADEVGAKISGRPLELAEALLKIQAYGKSAVSHGSAPATNPLFIFTTQSGSLLARLFSTHPPVSERVKRLEKIAAEMYGPTS